MCYFLTVGVREEGVSILENEQRRRAGLGVTPAHNPHIAALFPGGDKLFWITSGGCSCDLYQSPDHREPQETSLEKERARYRNKGWSEAKIKRAMEAKHAARSSVPRGQREDTPNEELHDLLCQLACVPGGVRIFAHQYSGAVDDEVVTGRRGETLSVLSVLEGLLPEDLVVDLKPSAGHLPRKP